MATSEATSDTHDEISNVKVSDKKEINVTGEPNSNALSDVEEEREVVAKRESDGIISSDSTKHTTKFNREEYLLLHRELSYEVRQSKLKNHILNRRLAEYYSINLIKQLDRKRKLDYAINPTEPSPDMKMRYQQKLLEYEDLNKRGELEQNDLTLKIQEIQEHFDEKFKNAKIKFYELQQFEKTTGEGLIYVKNGTPISKKTIDRYLSLQKQKTLEASKMMLKYIRLKNAVAKHESKLEDLEKIGPDQHVGHYETLLGDKTNYVNKIEERDDELIKNRIKCSQHNVMLAHIKEKMHHTGQVIDSSECDLGDALIRYRAARETLNQAKVERVKLRALLEAESLKAQFLTKKDLLLDYEKSLDEVVELREESERLKDKTRKSNLKLRKMRNTEPFSQPSCSNVGTTMLDDVTSSDFGVILNPLNFNF